MPRVAVIPAYEPSSALGDFAAELKRFGFAHMVVVDDGSSPASAKAFGEAAKLDGVTLLRHDRNLGKGAALKTAFAYVLANLPDCETVVTADADGQHAADDCAKVAQAAGDGMAIGTREFSLGTTPFRSWWGNRWTAWTFALVFGKWIADTQTGLRAFRRSLLPFLLSVPGEGYAYETAVLCAAARLRLPMEQVAVRTIYEAGNATSHFSPLADTLRIWRAMARERLKPLKSLQTW